MTDTTISTALRVKQWDDQHHLSYVRANRFRPYMGTNENAIIQLKEDLTKKAGDAITIPLVGALSTSGGPKDQTTTLVGNERALPNDGHQITVTLKRDAVVVDAMEEQVSPIDIRNAARVSLKDLQMRYLRTDVITALGSIGGVAYATATAGERNAWNAANSDRVLFGRLKSNYSATHATALANIASAATLNKAVVSLMKRIAQTAVNANGDGIRPYKFGDDEETYVMFVGTHAFRDLKNDIGAEWRDAMERGKNNPLFVGTTSIYWDGVVVREIPEIPVTGNVGASSATVAPIYLCGAQALGAAWAQRTKTTLRKEDDYGVKYGVGFQEIRGLNKLRYGSAGADWSVVTGFIAAAADA
jgi:hypothetical protein